MITPAHFFLRHTTSTSQLTGSTWSQNISNITGIGFSGIDGGSGRGSINGQRTAAYPIIATDNSYTNRGAFIAAGQITRAVQVADILIFI